jgi:RAB protein geranylgeranyltransferase component A
LSTHKLLLSAGILHQIFEGTKASVKFKQIENACARRGETLHSIPITRMNALSSPLISKMQHLYAQNFFLFLEKYASDGTTKREGIVSFIIWLVGY